MAEGIPRLADNGYKGYRVGSHQGGRSEHGYDGFEGSEVELFSLVTAQRERVTRRCVGERGTWKELYEAGIDPTMKKNRLKGSTSRGRPGVNLQTARGRGSSRLD